MKNIAIVATAVLLTCIVLSRPVSAASVNEFIDFSLRDENNAVVFPGRLHVPVTYSQGPNTRRPLILFLHGAGEAGTDNLKQINGNIDNLLAGAIQRDAFLYAPQNVGSFANSLALYPALAMIDRAIADFNADPSRIYVTGLSQGGGDVWYFVDERPDRFAAGVSIAGGPPSPFFLATNLPGEPLWAFHARNDGSAPVQGSRYVISEILQNAGEQVPTFPPLNDITTTLQFDNQRLDLHYTELAQGGHGIWPAVYQRADMYDWMFSHVQVPEPASVALSVLGASAAFLGFGNRAKIGRRAR